MKTCLDNSLIVLLHSSYKIDQKFLRIIPQKCLLNLDYGHPT